MRRTRLTWTFRGMKWPLGLLFLAVITLSACGDDGDNPGVTPELTLQSVEIAEGDAANSTAVIEVRASAVASDDITFNYTTVDGTAKEGDDYVSASGTATISAGEQATSIEITIVADDHLELFERFELQISNITNATTGTGLAFLTIRDDDPSFDIEEDADGFITPETYPSMELIWSDEFNDAALNTANWSYDLGDGCDLGEDLCGWGNDELQLYTDESANIRLEDGKLIITATEPTPNAYESARITTKNKQVIQYGRIDIRAKLPEGQGLWPALWLLGSNIDEVSWPASGEIDLMELVGHEPNKIHGTVHFDRNGHQFIGSSRAIGLNETFGDQFHVFTLLWDESGIEWYLDYNKFYQVAPSDIGDTYPFDNPFYFLFNVAVGGQWPGIPDDTTTFPQEMVVDYVRVFR